MAVVIELLPTETSPFGHLLRKRATTASDRARLVHEATALGLAQHPGVVEVAGLADHDDATELTLRWAGDRCVVPGTLPPRRAAALVARLARTVAALHERGLVHGRIGVQHLVLTADQHPILCGFADAHLFTDDDPARFERGRAADVAALGELLLSLLAPDATPALVPEHRRRVAAAERQSQNINEERRLLLTLADQAAAAGPDHHITADTFATLLGEALPGIVPAAEPAAAAACAGVLGAPHTTPPRPTGRLRRPEPWRRNREPSDRSLPLRAGATALAALAGLALVASGVAHLGHGARPHLATGNAAPARSCRPVAQPAATPSGVACPVPVHVKGRTVTIGQHRYELGRPGDVVAVAPWRCGHEATPALLRPATGEVFVFTTWATPNHDLTVQPVGVVHGATALRATYQSNSCANLLATRPDGSRVPVNIPSSSTVGSGAGP